MSLARPATGARHRLLCVVVGLGVSSVSIVFLALWMYPTYVEREFVKCMNALHEAGQVTVTSSRCVGRPSERIRFFPVLYSRITGRPPFRLEAEREDIHLRTVYWHGYSFSYAKMLSIGSTTYTAYWSVRENRWHAGNFTLFASPAGYRSRWSCLEAICAASNHVRIPERP